MTSIINSYVRLKHTFTCIWKQGGEGIVVLGFADAGALAVWLRIGLCPKGGAAPGWPARISPVMNGGNSGATRA